MTKHRRRLVATAIFVVGAIFASGYLSDCNCGTPSPTPTPTSAPTPTPPPPPPPPPPTPTAPAVPVGDCLASTSGLISTVTWTWSSAGPQVTYELSYTDPSEHPQGQSLWQDIGSHTSEGPSTNLTAGAQYTIYVRAKNTVGTSTHTKITCDTPVPDGTSQYGEVRKIAHLGNITGGYTLQQFKDEKAPSDPNNPTIAPYPYLTWRDDDCSIQLGAIIQVITGWGDYYTPIVYIGLIPVPILGAPKAPLKEGCWRHDFAWRNLSRIQQRWPSVNSWNQTNYHRSNNRLKSDWHDICGTTYNLLWISHRADCRFKSTLAWEALELGTSVEGYNSNADDTGYVQ